MGGDIQWSVFTYIVSQVETPLINSVSEVTTAFLNYAKTPLQLALVLYVALTGLLIIRGYATEAASTIVTRVIKLSLIAWVITGAGIYQQYIYDFFFTTMPNDLSNAVTSGGTTQAVTSNSFDTIWIKAWAAGLDVWKSLEWYDFGEKIVVVAFWTAGILSTVFCFAIWLISRVLLALYIAIGPLLVGLALFPATASIFQRWIGSMISCVILQVTTVVLLYIVLTVEQQVVGTVATISSADPMTKLQVLLAGVIFFAVAAYVALQLPGVATSLAGGLHFHTGALARAGFAALSQAGRTAGRTAAAAAGQPARLGRAVGQRLRPSPGGSLSDRTPRPSVGSRPRPRRSA